MHRPLPNRPWLILLALLIVAGTVGAILWHRLVPPAIRTYTPQDRALHRPDVYLFHARRPTRALVWLYGNDVAFWHAHEELATIFTEQGCDVIGFDARRFFDHTAVRGPRRDSVVSSTIADLLARTQHEFGDDSLPVILAGHSLGANLAAWTGVHVRIPHLAGILMLNPTRRSHLYATLRDRTFLGEPTEPGSYAATDMLSQLPPRVPVVIMRGDHDPHTDGDSALVQVAVASGHAPTPSLAYHRIPFAGHSLRSLVIAGPVIARVLDDMVPVQSPESFEHR